MQNDPITQAKMDSEDIFGRYKQQVADVVINAIEAHLPGKLAEIRLAAALERLDHLAAKEAGWKGPDSVAMPETVRVAAETFLRSNFSDGWMPTLFIGLDADGDITVFIKNEQLTMDLSIGTDQLYSCHAKLADDSEFDLEEVLVTEKLPEKVLAALRGH